MRFFAQKSRENWIKVIFIALKSFACRFFSDHKFVVSGVVLALCAVVAYGAPWVLGAPTSAPLPIGTTETLNVYPGHVVLSDWQGEENILISDLSGDAMFQSFSKSNAAYVSKRVGAKPADVVDDISPTGDDTSDTTSDVSTERDDTEVTTPSESAPDDVEIAPEENAATQSEPASEQSPDNHEPVSQAPVLKRATDSVVAFLTSAAAFPFAIEDVPVFEGAPNVPTEPIATDSEPEIIPVENTIPSPSETAVAEPVATSTEETIPDKSSDEKNSTRRITLGDFSTLPLEPGQVLKNLQLRASLGAHTNVNADGSLPYLEFTVDTGSSSRVVGSVVLDGEVSNAINGGHFLFALPSDITIDQLATLEVTVAYVGDLNPDSKVFLDALWLEVEIETIDKELLLENAEADVAATLEDPTMYTLLSDRVTFAEQELPRFSLRYNSQRNFLVRFFRDLAGRNLASVADISFVHDDIGDVGVLPDISITKEGLINIEIDDKDRERMRPGEYTVILSIDEGGEIFTDTFAFQWGMLAINSNKSDYQPNEQATITMGALSPNGNTICDATLLLYIIDPHDGVQTAPVTPSGACNGNNVVDVPDYSATFTPTIAGEYEMYLERVDGSGAVLSYTSSLFAVSDALPLSIVRDGPTRIYPRSTYPMELTVVSDAAWSGTLVEVVPADFEITDTQATIKKVNGAQELSWDVQVDQDHPFTASYTFDAPDISPYLYTLGKARLEGKKPKATLPAVTETTPETEPTPSPSVPDEPTPAAPQPEPVTPAPSNDPEPAAPETPPAPEALPTVSEPNLEVTPDTTPVPPPAEAPVAPETAPAENEPVTLGVPDARSFVLEDVVLDTSSSTPDTTETDSSTARTASSTEVAPASNVAFEEHRQWQIASDATGSMIVYWANGATVPAGWTCLSCGSGTFYQKFVRGGATYNSTGGSATHTHNASGTVNASTGANSENRAGTLVAIDSHAHTYTPTITSSTTLPAYRQLRAIQYNSAGEPPTIPVGAVLMFDGSLPVGWTRYTQLDNRYPRGENTILNAGTSTHRHTISGSTGAASGSTVDSRTGGTQVTAAANTHTHTVSSNTGYVNHEPPYISVIFATTTTAAIAPTSTITMWTDTPPAQWQNASATTTDPFYDKFIKGSATYGTTGGALTHTHSNVTGITTSAAVGTDNARTGARGASSVHTHSVDVTNFTSASNLPPYVTAIFARKYGAVALYTQSKFRWYVNTNASTPTDAWPVGSDALLENEAIDASNVPVKNGDVVRLRLQLSVTNSTSTSNAFKLQFATTTSVCTSPGTWSDVGNATSSSVWRGYNNAGVSDGATLSSSTLSGTDALESYEEVNPTVALPNQIGIAKDGEWDFVLQQNGAAAGATYCFRMVKSDGSTLFMYSEYPTLVTNEAPNPPTQSKLFDNEKVSTTTPDFEFTGSDNEADDLTYQIQVDDDYAFGSVNIDKNSVSNSAQFENTQTPADKDPFTQGELIDFDNTTALTNNTTYYWRVRAKDPNGSNTYGSWSTIRSFTIDTSLTFSTWFQTTDEQFNTNTLDGVYGLTDAAQLRVGSSTGTMYSDPITFSEGTVGTAWGSFSFNDTETSSDLKYTIQYNDGGTWTNIPDTVLSGNSAGFDTSPVSLLGVNKTTYTELRIKGTFVNSGATPTLQDWTVSWAYLIETPTITVPFDNEKVSTTTPTFRFTTTDPQGDSLQYQIQWSTTYAFTASTTRNSNVNAGFTNISHATDTDPFNSGDTIQFKIQAADALTNGTTYWWRVRARDPGGSNAYSFFTDPQSFTVDTTVTVSTWFQTTQSQFALDTLSNEYARSTGVVTVATTTFDSIVAYAEGVVTTPRYRTWNGTSWSNEANALDVGAAMNWVVTKPSPIESEYVMATMGTDADVNVQVYKNGAWGNLQEVTTSIANTTMRGFDVAYEQLSGDAMVVTCDGDANPTYYIWNGTSWTNGGAVGITSGNTCGWIKLISDPVSDEIIVVWRDTAGANYEARVWNGSSWGNSTTWGSMNQVNHEGIAAEYEESGNQAVVAVSNGTASSFIYQSWNGSAWSGTTAQTIGDDFESGSMAQDDGSDNLALCYVDEDGDIGVMRWTGAAFVAFVAATNEMETAWTTANLVYDDRPVECAFETTSGRDGYIMIVYSDTTNLRYRYWNGASFVAEASVSTVQDGRRVQVRRTGNGLIQAMVNDSTNDRYDYSYWNGTAWSIFQTLETNGAAGASPYKESFMMSAANPISIGTVVGQTLDFNNGSGPYWKQLSWTDTTTGGSDILYQVEYYDGDSWELVPNSLIPGNSAGTTTSPINLANMLPVTTYDQIRPVANMTCNAGTCPSLSDWTITWAAGINVSGTAQQYNQSTNVTSGTVAVAVNGVVQVGKTASISGGTWTIANVNAAPGDVVTVFITGASDSAESVAVTKYDGSGDITGMKLFERHLAIGSADNATISNANLSLYDFTNTEDVFYDVNGGNDLTICATTGCGDAELYIVANNIFQSGAGGDVSTHDFENNGTLRLNGNTMRVSGSWDNNATTTSATSTVIMTATSTSETFDETGAISPAFNNLTFGLSTSTATWTLGTALDVNGNLSTNGGTLARNSRAITIAGNFTNGTNGLWTGMATTTFDGATAATWSDASAALQNIGRVVIDGTTKVVTLGNNAKAQSIKIGADDTLDASTGNYNITVYKNWMNSNIFTARSGTVFFAATTTGNTITTGSNNFYNITFNGAGGAWSFTASTLGISKNLSITAAGTVTLPTATTSIAGSFTNSGGTFAHNNGQLYFTSGSAETLTLGGTAFTNAFYNAHFSGTGSWTFTEANATTSNLFRITQGTVTLPSNTLTIGDTFTNSGGTFTHNSGTVKFISSGTKVIDTNASFNHLRFSGSGSFSFLDSTVTALGNLTVTAGTLTLPSGTFSIGGSISNSATLTHNSGTVLMNSTDTGETIDLGSSSLYNLTFNSSSGGWTISQHATTTNNTTLTAASSFTLASGKRLGVGGMFTNSVGGAATTWTGSTLSLNAGTYSLNTKSNTGDAYATLRVAANTDIKMWNSSAATYTVDGTGSLYSQDHNAVDGDLYIYGNYPRSSGTEYWSSAYDFDGTALGVASRQVDVRFASGASASFSNSVVNISGSSTATTTVANQGSGTYTIDISSGTTTAAYYSFANLGTTGLNLTAGNKVTSLSYGVFNPGIGGGTGLTISSTTIDANPALQIYNVNFSTTSAIVANNVKQIDGTPSSYWWFRNSVGNLDGEGYDLDTGDPGSIRWDNSSLVITVSGTVYSDAGTTPLTGGTCDGATNVVRIVVEGGATYNGTCSAGNGTYSIGGVTIVGDPTLTIYLNDASGGQRATVVTKTATANITNADLYVNRVIVRHEDVSAMTIADMNAFDSANDSDVRYTAATTTGAHSLTVFAGNELYVWNSKTFSPGGVVTINGNGAVNSYDGSLYLASTSTFTGVGTTTYTIGGSFTKGAGATFVPASTTVVMNATTSGKTITATGGQTINFNNLNFTGTNGSWNVNTTLSLTGNMPVSAGTVTGTGNVTLLNGALSGNGLVSFGGGTVTLARTNTLGGTQGWTFNNLTLGNGSTVGTTTIASNATTTIGGVLTIANAHFFKARGAVLTLSGSGTVFTETGTFVEATSTVRFTGASASVPSTGYYNLKLSAAAGTPTYTATGLGLTVGGALTVGGTTASTFDLNTNDPALSVTGDVLITSNGTLSASNSGTFTVVGSWQNAGTFTSNSGTVTFSGAGTKTIAAGASSFATARLTGAGTYTVSQHATATAAFSLTGLTAFTLSSGQTLAVGGTFTNNVGGAATTWNGSTLSLYGGGNYTINPATTTDTYATIKVASNTHIRSWNSSGSTIDTATNGSLYSMDHANVDGNLYIYGDYRKTSGIDYWSYATDFTGTALGGSSRKVNVYFESGATTLYSGTSQLSVIGAAGASTTLQNQGSGTYSMTIGGTSSTTMDRYEVLNTASAGLTFTGSAVVHDLSRGYFQVGITGGSAITVGGSAITASPARTFTLNTFATSSGVTSAYNVTATGTSVSSWRFTNHSGAIDGEAYDSDPDGDPGYIVWDDSAASITIAGRVYSDEGVTASANCNGSTQNVHIQVAGLTSYTTSCTAGTGAYTKSGISYSPGDSVIVYLDGAAVGAAAVTSAPVSNISNMDLYERRVIVRHEGVSPLTIDAMAVWDSSDDADIPFTAINGSPDTLTLPANYKLMVWTSKSFAPGGNVTLSGGGAGAAYDGTLELMAGATWTSAGTQVHSIGGSLISGAGATFTAANSTTTFTTTGAARTIDINNGSFYNVAFTGSGSWTISDTLLDVQSFAQSAGTLTLPTGTTTVSASFRATGGSFTQNGPFVFDGTGTHIVRFDDSNVGPLFFTGSGSWSMTDANATSTGALLKSAGSLTLPSGTLALGGSFRNNSGAVTHNSGRVIVSSATTATLRAGGSDLNSVTFKGGGTYSMSDTNLTLLGSLLLTDGTLTLATGTLSIGGSLTVSAGSFAHASGTVLFNSADAGETITPLTSAFYNVVFGSATGGWTIAGSATTTHNFTLTNAANFTQQSGTTLTVRGVFTNSVGGAATTWTGSTLRLIGSNTYTANAKTTTGDRYQTLVIGANTDVSFWSSAATTTTVTSSGSLYSQDHAAVDGALYIYGDYHVGTTTNYWSYATDFDGTALGGSSRNVTVSIIANATTTLDGGTLNIVGSTGHETMITNQGSGTYDFNVTSGTFNAQYYKFRNLNSNGVTFTGTPTVSSLNYGDYVLAVSGGRLITLASTTLNANASLVISGNSFATSSAITGKNVYLIGSTSNAWTYSAHSGNLDGEVYDFDGATACGSIRWDDSSCLLTQQTHYRWRNDDGGIGVPNSEWYNGNWNARKSVRVQNVDATTYTNAAVKLQVTYDSDMQVDFDDLRFTSVGGTTTLRYFVERYTPGTSADVWVKIPSLPANSSASIYMYYSNGTASSTSSSTQTFTAADDFEDGNKTEYSGDTSLFVVDGTFAYGGSYGIDATGNESSRATDGIARFNQTVSRGEIIRYFQYIDTSGGSGDEACTLFGVQSPVTSNQNYAVCLEQVTGTDRISLARDVDDVDTSGVILASSTVAYSTGWYEVEVDWQTDNDLLVTLKQNGSVVTTVSANSSTYTSGGYGFTYWYQHGGWDNFSSRPHVDTAPTIRFGVEQTDGGGTWKAALDTAATYIVGDVARLRFVIENTGTQITGQTFDLEYAAKGAAPSCEAVSSASYATVPVNASCGSSPICMIASTNITNGASIGDLLIGPVINFIAGETIEDPSNTSDTMTLNQDEYTELEYALTPTTHATSSAYCLRVTDAGDPVDTYLKVAELNMQFDPIVSSISFNGGHPISLLPGTTTRIYATGTITDLNGYTDLSAVAGTSTMYSTSVAGNCAANNNNCYRSSLGGKCSYQDCAGDSCTLSCYADFYYFAEPTDAGGNDWVAFFEVKDASGGYDFNTSAANDVQTLHALDVTDAINYGSVSASSTTGATNASTSVANLGNAAIDINLNGTDLSDGYSSTIPVTYEKFATSTFNYTACATGCYNLSASSTRLEVDLAKPTSTTPVTDLVYWGIRVPFGVSSSPHSGVNTFYATAD